MENLKGQMELPWVEKYRPQKVPLRFCPSAPPWCRKLGACAQICDIVGNEDAVSRLQSIADQGNMPNLIITVRWIVQSTRSRLGFDRITDRAHPGSARPLACGALRMPCSAMLQKKASLS